ncbi:MAG: CcdB family protein [Thermomonas sp.]
MRQFCVYRNSNTATRSAYPLLLNVQSDLISETGTRVVVPMVPVVSMRRGRQPPVIKSLAPMMNVNEKKYVLIVPLLAAASISDLGKLEADLSHERPVIMAALDLLISGI